MNCSNLMQPVMKASLNMPEFTTIELDTSDFSVGKKGATTLFLDDFATNIDDANDVTFTDGGDIPTNWTLAKIGKGDGQEDIFRFNLTGFNDDFNISVISEGPEDVFSIITTSDPVISGGIYTFNYIGSDGLEQTVTIDPGDAEVVWTVVCFAAGTRIKTEGGEKAIEDLKVGDMVLTLDSGCQPIQWIGSRKLDALDLAANPKLKPIRIRANALGPGVPSADLIVSPQHRVLVRSAIAERMFGVREVLIPANKLLVIDGIDIELEAQSVEYFHILFGGHQIVFSNGAPTESLFTGPEAMKSVSDEAQAEMISLFPQMASPDYVPVPVRFIPEKGRQMKVLAQRLAKNSKFVVEQAV
jgi:Hint domain